MCDNKLINSGNQRLVLLPHSATFAYVHVFTNVREKELRFLNICETHFEMCEYQTG